MKAGEEWKAADAEKQSTDAEHRCKEEHQYRKRSRASGSGAIDVRKYPDTVGVEAVRGSAQGKAELDLQASDAIERIVNNDG